ncbi:SspB family protein [Paremcibacter congregatus]|mgnify:CR=1 FL=1|uniref:SspB family protein n=1 Tax=Paremcibacter congregatus TaxID=2043170 RepID=UPI0030EE4860|tara:strand:+ start:3547 stop:4014 length:468 start_codon:yes stop_codon:yes gene_type:complete
MTDTAIQYDAMVQVALLSVVRDVLKRTIAEGLPGEHHFYITFSTNHPNVSIPPYLKERYPEEMTIVIQNQYSDLLVDDSHFEISLSFNGKLEHLSIAFPALQGFFDPSVDFGLHFHADEDEEALPPIVEETPETPAKSADDEGDNVVALDLFRKK